MKRCIPALLLASSIPAACTEAPHEAEVSESAADAPQGNPDQADSAPPETLDGTAWRSNAEDGARFVTYLDADGTYRDLRNGEAYQTGIWTYASGARGKLLCFTPEEEAGVKTCWEPGRREGDNMIVTGPGGRRVELTGATYMPPENDTEADGNP